MGIGPQVASQLLSARQTHERRVSRHYDEVVLEVADRVATSGSVGKLDIGALILWKRLRADTPWAADLHDRPDTEVREVTQTAVSAVNDASLELEEAARRGRAALSSLPGFSRGDALASAVLYAASPHRMAVYDRRAQAGLESLGMSLSSAPGRYGRYLGLIAQLLDALNAEGISSSWTPRDVDLALYTLGDSR